MPTTEVIADMSDRREKSQVLAQVGALQGLWRVELTRYRPRRSDRQNRYYWPCVVKPLADFLRDQGEAYTDEDAHGILKTKLLRVSVVNKATGEVIGERVRSTTELSTEEFAEYVDKCIAWLADMFGIVCPDPRSLEVA